MRIGTQVFGLTPRPLPQCRTASTTTVDGFVDTADAGCSVVGAPGGSTVSQDDEQARAASQPKVEQ